MAEASFGLLLGLGNLCDSPLPWRMSFKYFPLEAVAKMKTVLITSLHPFHLEGNTSCLIYLGTQLLIKTWVSLGNISNIYKVNAIFFKYSIAWKHLSQVFFGFLHLFSINRVCHTPKAICVSHVKLLQGLLFLLTTYIPQMESLSFIFLS